MRFIYIGLLITVFSCGKQDREKSNELNKKGIDYYYKAVSSLDRPGLVYTEHDDKKVFADSCLYFMSEAIRIDSSNKSAYWNKLGFEFGLKRFEEAKTTAWLYYKIFDDAHGLMTLGAIYHQLNDSIKSKEYFKQALDFYDNRIKSGKFIEDSILLDLTMVNLSNNKIEESKEYYERYRATSRGQMIFKDIDFDSARQIFTGEPGNAR
jgi:tetratricopeptide (TPR) repeat protein